MRVSAATKESLGQRRCERCNQLLGPSNKDTTCRSTRACEERAELNHEALLVKKPISPEQLEFQKESYAWHIMQATSRYFNIAIKDLRISTAKPDAKRRKYIMCHLLRYDAQVRYRVIAQYLRFKNESYVHAACENIMTRFQQYSNDVFAIREIVSSEIKKRDKPMPPSTLEVVA